MSYQKLKNMKKSNVIKRWAMCLIVLLGMSTQAVFAANNVAVDEVCQSGDYVTITGTGVRMRYGPGLDYGYYKTSPKKGERLQLLGQSGDWYEVKYGNEVAYVFKQYAKLTQAPVKQTYLMVTGNGVRLRKGPGLDYDFLKWKDGTVRGPKKGERVVCLGETSDWYKVRYANGEYYIFKQYAKKVK